MKKHKIIGLLACLLAVGLLLMVKYHQRTVPFEECSQIYRDYADNPHIAVAFIKDFRVGSANNDTLAVDVTTLHADSDSAWYALLLDFGTPEELFGLYKSNSQIFVGEDISSIVMFHIDKDNPRKRLPSTHPDSRLVIGSLRERSLSVFMTDDDSLKQTIGLSETKKLGK